MPTTLNKASNTSVFRFARIVTKAAITASMVANLYGTQPNKLNYRYSMTQSKNLSDRLTLPWPPKELSPNYRGHWGPVASAKKKYRFAVRILALQQPIPFIEHIVEDAPIFLEVEFYPPDNRPRDQDNMIASFKAGQDGLADAWKVNDKRINCTYKISQQKGGMVKVRVL